MSHGWQNGIIACNERIAEEVFFSLESYTAKIEGKEHAARFAACGGVGAGPGAARIPGITAFLAEAAGIRRRWIDRRWIGRLRRRIFVSADGVRRDKTETGEKHG
jgi:hypothetical protein